MPTRFDAKRLDRDAIARGWNWRTLAKHAGVAPSTVGRFMYGTFQTPDTAKKLADAVGYPLQRYMRTA
jgi:hypothetical protein